MPGLSPKLEDRIYNNLMTHNERDLNYIIKNLINYVEQHSAEEMHQKVSFYAASIVTPDATLSNTILEEIEPIIELLENGSVDNELLFIIEKSKTFGEENVKEMFCKFFLRNETERQFFYKTLAILLKLASSHRGKQSINLLVHISTKINENIMGGLFDLFRTQSDCRLQLHLALAYAAKDNFENKSFHLSHCKAILQEYLDDKFVNKSFFAGGLLKYLEIEYDTDIDMMLNTLLCTHIYELENFVCYKIDKIFDLKYTKFNDLFFSVYKTRKNMHVFENFEFFKKLDTISCDMYMAYLNWNLSFMRLDVDSIYDRFDPNYFSSSKIFIFFFRKYRTKEMVFLFFTLFKKLSKELFFSEEVPFYEDLFEIYFILMEMFGEEMGFVESIVENRIDYSNSLINESIANNCEKKNVNTYCDFVDNHLTSRLQKEDIVTTFQNLHLTENVIEDKERSLEDMKNDKIDEKIYKEKVENSENNNKLNFELLTQGTCAITLEENESNSNININNAVNKKEINVDNFQFNVTAIGNEKKNKYVNNNENVGLKNTSEASKNTLNNNYIVDNILEKKDAVSLNSEKLKKFFNPSFTNQVQKSINSDQVVLDIIQTQRDQNNEANVTKDEDIDTSLFGNLHQIYVNNCEIYTKKEIDSILFRLHTKIFCDRNEVRKQFLTILPEYIQNHRKECIISKNLGIVRFFDRDEIISLIKARLSIGMLWRSNRKLMENLEINKEYMSEDLYNEILLILKNDGSFYNRMFFNFRDNKIESG